jgi:hypothetical protein
MRLQRLKKYALGAVGMLVLVMAILLATGWGSAVAAQISNVFVTNDASHAVPVASADQTEVVLQHTFTTTGGTQIIDVRGYRTIRIAMGSTTGCTSSVVFNLKVVEVPHAYNIDTVPCDQLQVSRTYAVPGTTLVLGLFGDPGSSADIIVLGRRN